MQYDISITENIAYISVEGNLNALDLLFMLQSKEYKGVIKQYKKILIDYTNISGVTLTSEVTFTISMLGKVFARSRRCCTRAGARCRGRVYN